MTKLQKLRTALLEKGVDALLVLDELNQRYLSDFAFTDGLLLITQNRADLITDFRYFELAEKKANKNFKVVMPEKRAEYIAQFLASEGVKTLGFEGNFVSYNTYRSYAEKFPSVELVNVADMVEVIRQVKTPEEIELMQ